MNQPAPAQVISPTQQLLIQRTAAMLMTGHKPPPRAPFVAVRGILLGSAVAPWVMLTTEEFMECTDAGGLQ